ncbi:MAG: hypothetical protein ACKOYC_02075, partial [Bacteroidota bacterium]
MTTNSKTAGWFHVFILVTVLFLCTCVVGWVMTLKFSDGYDNISNSGRVQMADGGFVKDGKPFFPLVVNYIVALHKDSSGFWLSPSRDYMVSDTAAYSSQMSAALMIKADMQLIRELGFNCVRIVGVGELIANDPFSGRLSMRVNEANGQISVIPLLENDNYEKYFSALENLFSIIESEDLEAIFLTRIMPGYFSTESHLIKLTKRF